VFCRNTFKCISTNLRLCHITVLSLSTIHIYLEYSQASKSPTHGASFIMPQLINYEHTCNSYVQHKVIPTTDTESFSILQPVTCNTYAHFAGLNISVFHLGRPAIKKKSNYYRFNFHPPPSLLPPPLVQNLNTPNHQPQAPSYRHCSAKNVSVPLDVWFMFRTMASSSDSWLFFT